MLDTKADQMDLPPDVMGTLPATVVADGTKYKGAGAVRGDIKALIGVTAAGELVPLALQAVRKGGTVVCGGIHMSDIPSFPYHLLWEERRLVTVANLTRADAVDYLARAARAGVRAHVTTYALRDANRALSDLRSGAFSGAAVLRVGVG